MEPLYESTLRIKIIVNETVSDDLIMAVGDAAMDAEADLARALEKRLKATLEELGISAQVSIT